MPKKCYLEKSFKPESLAMVDQVNEIIEEYQAQGFELTLRQLYYQFVSRDLLPNNLRSYKNLGSLVNDARLAGLVDWEAIVDRTRELRGRTHWTSPAEILKAAATSYCVDRWTGQPARPEVWIEKDALLGVFEGVCQSLDVSYFSCRGYTSQSEMWEAARRMTRRHAIDGQKTVVLHFGDHDPSGVDMSRDISDRLAMFTAEVGSDIVDLERIALTHDQVEQYKPPPNPAKLTDSRATSYVSRYGRESWELDALDPKVLAELVRRNVNRLVKDPKLWNKAAKTEELGRKKIVAAGKNL